MSMITASLWVPRGAAAQFPGKYSLDEGEVSRISKLAQLQIDDAKDDLESARKGVAETSDDESGEENGVQLNHTQGSVD